MKKIFQILIIPIILLSLCVDVCGETIYTEDTFKYVIRDNEVVITKYFGTEEEVTVPRLINNMPVTIIATGAFVDTYAKLVYLPDSIAYIEPGAFSSSTMYFGEYEEENTEKSEEREEDHRIDNNDGSIEGIPSLEIGKITEEGEVDVDGNIVVENSDYNNTNKADENQINDIVTAEESYGVSFVLYIAIGLSVVAIFAFVVIKKKLKNDRN